MTATLDYTRQKDWFDPAKAQANVTIVGCGGIGSFAAFALAKLGVQTLRLVDFDTVEEHNVPNQMFRPDDVTAIDGDGATKVVALSNIIEEFTGTTAEWHPDSIAAGVPLSDIVIAGLDSMAARRELWEQVKLKPRVKLFIDGRLSGQRLVLYCVRPMDLRDIEGYEATLYDDDTADETSCTAKSIIDVGFTMAALITRAVRMYYANEEPIPLVYMDQETLDLYKGDWSCR